MKHIRAVLCCFLCGIIILSMSSCGISAPEIDTKHYKTNTSVNFTKYKDANFEPVPVNEVDQQYLNDYEFVCENKFLALYLQRETAAVAVADKRTGDVWYTNHPEIKDDSEISEDTKQLFYSQLYVEYLDNPNFKQIDSYSTSVKDNMFSIETSDKGITVTYRFKDTRTANIRKNREYLFEITLQYTLQNESMIVTLPSKGMSYDSDMPPLAIHVLPHFGGAPSKEDGYLFIPDGSGALIEFNSDTYSVSSYTGSVYGPDETNEVKTKSSYALPVYMPVFGVKQASKSFLAIIEDSAAFANIRANRAGPYSSYNEVYSSFNVHAYQNISIGGMSTATKLIGIQDSPYQGDIQIRYAFLEPDSTYVDMADYYRSYMLDKNNAEKIKTAESVPMHVEFIGAIDKTKSTLGFQYNGIETLTTATQASEILQDLKNSGIKNISANYSGWFNGGLKQQLATRIKVEKAIGGKKGLTTLMDFANKSDIPLYFSINLLTTPPRSKGFNKFTMSVRQIDQRDAKKYTYDYVTKEGISYSSILNPGVLQPILDRFGKKASKMGITRLDIQDIGSNVFADYTEGKIIDRETTVNIYRELLKKQSGEYQSLMTHGGFAYTFPYVDIVVDAPFSDSGFDMVDRPVPFYQIVYHGYVQYSGSPLNLSYDFTADMLRLIEYGGSPYYQVMAGKSSSIMGTDYSYLCSNTYDNWKDKIKETYSKINQVLAPSIGQTIVDHKKIQDDVFMTKYENGYKVYVNYSDKDVSADGQTIPARNFSASWEVQP
ncbi:MAG TPA: hypothetical protein GXX54_07170 [Clostridiales bacterium]|jgi:hypothetical protein|nr:hypothetical protein [Clostridiales bacterium]